jgi:ADP-ribose pyrophosphatase YjhB (NUDIX family)
MDKNLVLVSAGTVYREKGSDVRWFIVKSNTEDEWEIPKVVVRKGESSVRAILRIIGEKGGMTARVIEEVGRSGGVTSINKKTVPQRHIYYLMISKNSVSEPVGFSETAWLEYSKAIKKLNSKREKSMLKEARTLYLKIKKEKSKKKSS